MKHLKTFSLTFKIILIVIIPLISVSLINGDRNKPADSLDLFGVQEIYPSKKGTTDWILPKDGIPGAHKEITFSGKGINKLADGIYSGKSQVGALASGGTQLTFRLYITPNSGPAETDHTKLAQRGYMVSPKDWKNVEQTGYFRITNPKTIREAITCKLRGGSHTSGNNGCEGVCYGVITPYTSANITTLEKEYSHPNYVFYKPAQLFDYGSIIGKWIGVKAIIYDLPNGDVKIEHYVDIGGLDPRTGAPANQWKKVDETIDDGKMLGTTKCPCNPVSPTEKFSWGGKNVTWRIDEVDSVEFQRLSIREIDVKGKF